MTPATAIAFLRRKHDLIVRSTCDPDERTQLSATWAEIFAALSCDVKLAALQKLDRALNRAMKRQVYDWDVAPIRKVLREEFGLFDLTNEEIVLAAVPAPAPGDVTLAPSGRRRPETRRFRDVNGIEHTCVDTSAATVGDLAQFFADYTGKTVRLSVGLAGRGIPPELRATTSEADQTEVVAALRCFFEFVHVLVLNGDGEFVLKDVTAWDAAREAAGRSKPATAEDVERARSAMSLDQFWEMVEATRIKSGDGVADPEQLRGALARRPLAEILGFQLRLAECLATSYRLDLWAVAYLVKGGCSNDGFDYFRGWLIAQGRTYFEAALADAERAADRAEGRDSECEEMLGVALQAWAQRSKKPMPAVLVAQPARATGPEWTEADLPRLYPQLAARFCGSEPGREGSE